jgi:hypothetical protein
VPLTTVSRAGLDAWLARVAAQVNSAPKNAALKLRGLRPVTCRAASAGCCRERPRRLFSPLRLPSSRSSGGR